MKKLPDSYLNERFFSPLNLMLFGLVLIGLFFRIFKANLFPGINGDELVGTVLFHQWLEGSSVDLFMPSGHVGSPLFFLLLLPFAFFHPATWPARLPGVIAGIALLISHICFGRRVYTFRIWLLSLVFLACFPLAIVMSRVSWEPALTPFLIWWLLYFLRKQRIVLSLLATVLATLNQIVAILIFPAVVLRLWFNHQKLTRYLKICLSVTIPIVAIFVWITITRASLESHRLLERALVRMLNVPEIVQTLYRLFKMFVGVTPFRGFALAANTKVNPLYEYTLPILSGLILAVGLGLAKRNKNRDCILQICFFFFSFFPFFLFAEPIMLEMGYERYPLYVFVPFCMAFAFALEEISTTFRRHNLGKAMAFGIGGLALVMFYQLYLTPFEEGGGYSSQLYSSAKRDPKVLAIEEAILRLGNRPNKVIITDGWFVYFTAKYFTYGKEGIQVFHRPSNEAQQNYQNATLSSAEQLKFVMDNGGIAFGLAGGSLRDVFLQQQIPVQSQVYTSTSGAPIVEVWEKK